MKVNHLALLNLSFKVAKWFTYYKYVDIIFLLTLILSYNLL